MTITVPRTLVEMRESVRERCQLNTNDPRFSDTKLNRIINGAMQRLSISTPYGFMGEVQEVGVGNTLSVGIGNYAVDTLLGVSRVRLMWFVILRQDIARWSLERVGRAEQEALFPNVASGQASRPRCYSLLGDNVTPPGMRIYFRPLPDRAYEIESVGVTLSPADLVNDGDLPAFVQSFGAAQSPLGDAWLELAASYVFRATENPLEARAARQQYDRLVRRARQYQARAFVGAGHSETFEIQASGSL